MRKIVWIAPSKRVRAHIWWLHGRTELTAHAHENGQWSVSDGNFQLHASGVAKDFEGAKQKAEKAIRKILKGEK